ncbi:pentatricopeptide repeat-containing protein At5g06540-like [Impatiens glandulifera]|uniref:pentatricopeptide repeat-containing protein At5g06540-like n=1 Tax=Impatiens glandulifera TaxID=253017 RepID=UPI001FB0D9F9|nr:pentatricopeptide repeat-containing protein At5g06540-like [Impatiens glandulifera]
MAAMTFMEPPPLPLVTIPNPSLEPSPVVSKRPNKAILKLLNTKCTISLQNLKQAHAFILKNNQIKDHYVAGTLLKCYAIPDFKTFTSSFKVFNQIANPNVFVFNALIKGCLHNNRQNKALSLYQSMVSVDANMNKFTYPDLLKACSDLQDVKTGMQIHAHVVKHGLGGDRHIKSSGIHMYASFGKPIDARNVLYCGGKLDIVCLNAMIDGYMKCGDVEAAKDLFNHTEEKNVETWNAIISGLVKCGMIEDARKMFDEMPERDIVSYGAMIDGYNKGDEWKKEAMEINLMMHKQEQFKMNEYVLSCSIIACANIGALDFGKQIHTYINTNSIPINALIGNSLIDMYAQCGQIALALSVFENIESKVLSNWNAMISAFALHGQAEDSVRLFRKMQRRKVNPNHVTFVNMLNSFLNEGKSIEKGVKYLKYMKSIYGIDPIVDHYVCVVNILGKAGMITEAEELINSMTIKPNAKVWGALLNSCLMHENLGLGEKIGKMLVEMEPENGRWYELLTKIYAKGGKSEEVEKLREVMKEPIIGRRSSMIYVNGEVHVFEAGEENSHPKMKEIEAKMGEMVEKMKPESVFDCSEKLAIALGLVVMTNGDERIHVVNNRRICDDSHLVVKAISRVYERKIIVRDGVSYHKFVNGICSCNDFW